MSQSITVGTRGSALALAQVELFQKALLAAQPDVKIKVKKITTSGDKRTDFSDVKADGAGVKGLFTKEIEQALLDEEIDVAVHSCKDLPGHLAEGLSVCATLERANTADIFIGRAPFFNLPEDSVVGTSSVRRRRQLLWLRPAIRVEEMRGNVPTRLEKLRTQENLGGIVLAKAGVDRLGLDLSGWHVEELSTLPAVGQGAIALQCRTGDKKTTALLAKVNHQHTFTCVRAERELLRLLNGDCHLPVGVTTRFDSGILCLKAVIFGPEGEPPLTGSAFGSGESPEEVAKSLFEKINP